MVHVEPKCQLPEPQRDIIVCSKNIIDCCSYSNEDLFLYHDGLIICQKYSKNEERKIKPNRHLKRIIIFNDELYGLTKRGLYVLSMNYYETCYWVFTLVKWAPKNIIDVNTTLDEKCLWIQTNKKCYLFDCHNHKTKFKCCYRRVYGLTKNSYLEFKNNNICDIIINNKVVNTIDDVTSGVIDHHHQITFLYNDDQYKEIRMVNYKPYYINI